MQLSRVKDGPILVVAWLDYESLGLLIMKYHGQLLFGCGRKESIINHD